jgi:hypothetical protein
MEDSLEHILLKEIIQAIRDNNELSYRTAITHYKKSSELDTWKIHMLDKIKGKIVEKPVEDVNEFL